MPARFVSEARAELFAQADHYDSKRPGLGGRFIAEVEKAVDFAARFPEAGSPWLHGTRRVFTRRFPFAVVYRSSSDGILILAVAHARRRPDYWRGRTPGSR
jgi:plasmid stabilization system protein ParE